MLTVLFTSAGRRNQLIACFRESAESLHRPLRVLAADMFPQLSPACHQADQAFRVNACYAPEYIQDLLQICSDHKVDLLVPTIDPELSVLSRHRSEFARVGTRVVVSSVFVSELAQDKFQTAATLQSAGVSTPRTFRLSEYLDAPSILPDPVIAKPNSGSGSRGIIRPRSPLDLVSLQSPEYIVQELWQGLEYTVNMFFDLNGQLRCAIPHRRLEVRSGEVSKGRTERIETLIEASRKMASVLNGAQGPLCFQAIVRPDGSYCVFEINARFGGGYPLAHQAGARFAQWLLEELEGREVSALDDWESGLTMLRFDTAVFCKERD
jgi:carbamoyl-phosphate synthase large subunit